MLSIGDNVSIGPRVTLVVVSHPNYSKLRGLMTEKPAHITIGDNVWIGAGAIILSGVTLAPNSVVAAGAVVTRDTESGTIVGGIPAKVIKRIEL